PPSSRSSTRRRTRACRGSRRCRATWSGWSTACAMISPDWPAPPRVRAFVTTRALGDVKDPAVREKLRAMLPAEPAWLKQVHGTRVIDLDDAQREGDAAFTGQRNRVCVVQAADCMPVLFADEE